MRFFPPSILVSLLLFFVSAVLMFGSFVEVQKRHNRQLPILASFPFGESYYLVEYKSAPIGSAKVLTNELDETVDVQAAGKIFISIQEQKHEVSFSLNIHVNSVGQLGASIFKIDFPNLKLAVGTGNVNPIKVSIKAERGDQVYNFSRQVPGPVLGKRVGANTLDMVYGGTLNKLLTSSYSINRKIPLEFKSATKDSFVALEDTEIAPLVVEDLYRDLIQELVSIVETLKQIGPNMIPVDVEQLLQQAKQL